MELRGVVPTPKFTCITSVLVRGVDDAVLMLEARSNRLGATFQSEVAYDQARMYMKLRFASPSSFGKSPDLSNRMLDVSIRAGEQRKAFSHAADSIARVAVTRADMLLYLSAELKLVPEYPPPVYVIPGDTVVLQGGNVKSASCAD